MPIVTLLTDFGLKDPYVAQVKGVILRNCPNCEIVDITHEVSKHNIVEGSFLLERTVSYFPNGSIHVAVVDPGVGSGRLPVVVDCRGGALVGPDNGLLYKAAEKLGLRNSFEIETRRSGAKDVSATFHGRDIFARTAGLLADGASPDSFGPRIAKIVQLKLPEPKASKEEVRCKVLYVDSFGNIITNIPKELITTRLRSGQKLRVSSGRKSWGCTYVRTYSDVGRGKLAILLGSQGFLEVAAREALASSKLGVKASDELGLRLLSRPYRSGKSL